MLDELSRLDPHTFHELCAVLLTRKFPALKAPDGSGGDEGIDAWIPETRIYFQFHAPRTRIRQDKLRRYLERVKRHDPLKWIFITNRDFTRAQWRWFDALVSTVPFSIEAWGATKLIEQLQQHPDLRDYYLSPANDTLGIRISNQNATHITNVVNFNTRGHRKPRTIIPGTLSADPKKLGYLKYLVRRYIAFKEWEVGKNQMRYPVIYAAYRREIKYSLNETPLDRFEEACRFLQHRIENTKLARTKKGAKLYPTFDEFVRAPSNPTAS